MSTFNTYTLHNKLLKEKLESYGKYLDYTCIPPGRCFQLIKILTNGMYILKLTFHFTLHILQTYKQKIKFNRICKLCRSKNSTTYIAFLLLSTNFN